MLVLSRQTGQSVSIKDASGTRLLTVVGIENESDSASLLINQANVDLPGDLLTKTIKLRRSQTTRVGDSVEVTLIDVHEEKVRLGFVSPRDVSICRLEFLQQKGQKGDEPEDDGGAVSPVPRPSSPTPPSINVQLDEPENEDDESS